MEEIKDKATSRTESGKGQTGMNGNGKVPKAAVPYILGGLGIFMLFIYTVSNIEDFSEGYLGMARLAALLLVLLGCAFISYKIARKKERKWYVRTLFFALFLVLTGVSAFGITQMVKDLAGNRLKTYEGPFTLSKSGRESRVGTLSYHITWEGDQTSAWSSHAINTEHFYSLPAYATARITYWENTGIVKIIEPKIKKVAGE